MSAAFAQAAAASGASPSRVAFARSLLALCLAPLLGGLVFAAPPPFFPQMARDLGVGVPLLGQAIAAMLLFGGVCTLVAGPLADRNGPRRLLVLGAVAAAASLLGMGAAPTYPAFLVAGAVGGIAWATLPALSMAVAGTAFDGDARRRAVGWATAALAVGEVAALPLLVALAERSGWRAAFVAAGAFAALAAAVMAVALPADPPADPLAAPAARVRWLAAYRPLLTQPGTARLLGATTLRAVCWIALLTYAGGFFGEALGLGLAPGTVGLAYALGAAGYVVGGVAAGRLLAVVPARVLAPASHAALAGLTVVVFLGVGGVAAAVAALAVAGVVGAAGWVASVALLGEESEAGAGATMALNGALFNLGAAAGGAAGGVVVALGGYAALAVVLPVFPLAAAVLVARASPRPAEAGATAAA